ncbi:phage head closure protein [Haemophilus haemolyticus]|uniref:Head-tail adaptor protein n=1 Tax=Haemophilus haemolyticus TaxID=726 RepID=A0A0M3G6G6_HAEHA|nr:phage head closure protein [Haemophilus haemolyticus]KKZ58562.1 head-tail adaptor protein [Haemophilus haemolyticus]
MAVMLKAGKYNKVIGLQKQVNEPNDYGGIVSKWRTIANVRAAVEPLQGREFFSGAVPLGENIVRVRVRYGIEVDRTMRVKYGTRLLEITNIIDSKESHRELQLICKELLGNGTN